MSNGELGGMEIILCSRIVKMFLKYCLREIYIDYAVSVCLDIVYFLLCCN